MRLPSARARRNAVRCTAAFIIVAAPIIVSAWAVRNGPDRTFPHERITPPTAMDTVDSLSPAGRVAAYLRERNPVVDRLLPAGDGGTLFFEHLDGKAAGMAFPATASIAVETGDGMLAIAESVELHERAHLLHAFARPAVNALLARLGHPRPDLYAVTNPGEHFAEMAAGAWDVLVPPRGMCLALTPLERLVESERDVPGTAGFVVWYLGQPAMTNVENRALLLARAESLSAPVRAEWARIGDALHQRRSADGTFEPWHAMSVRQSLESFYGEMRRSPHLVERIASVTLLPSLAVVKLFG